MSKKISALVSGLVTLFLIACLVGLIFAMLRLTNGFSDDFKTFYISRGDVIYSTTDFVKLGIYEEQKYDVKYLLENDDDKKGFNVKVCSYATADTQFEYKVDGEPALYGVNTNLDLSKAFNLTIADGCFAITAPKDFQTVLESVYPDKEITLPDTLDVENTPYFVVLVTSYNEVYTRTLRITFTPYVDVGGVTLPNEEIIL